MHRERGSALVGAVVVAVVAGVSLGVALTLNASYNRSAYMKSDSEAALLLAEAGVNDELNAISAKLSSGQFGWSTQPTVLANQKYAGRAGSVPESDGTYWVFTSSDADGKTKWDGTTNFYIHCTAEVNGSVRKVRIGGPNQPFQSPFSSFTIFGLDDSSSSNQPNIALSGSNTVVDIKGGIGTNGRVQGGTGQLTFTAGFNYNFLTYEATPSDQIVGSNIYRKPERLILPRVVDVIKQTIPACVNMTDSEAWDYIRNNRAQTSKVKTWKSGLDAGAVLSPENVTTVNYGSGTGAYSLGNKSGSGLGRWTTANYAPGSRTKKTLIFQPGDYYFESLDLLDNVNTELIIDNAGLTVPGGNPGKDPVRFFVTGTAQSDQLELEIKQTDTSDPAALRVFYSKPGSVFYVRRPTGWANGQTFSTMIGVYGVTGVTGGNGSRISINGGNGASDWLSVTGGFIADRIEFSGHCKVIHPGDFMAKKKDPISGVGYASGYTDN